MYNARLSSATGFPSPHGFGIPLQLHFTCSEPIRDNFPLQQITSLPHHPHRSPFPAPSAIGLSAALEDVDSVKSLAPRVWSLLPHICHALLMYYQ